MILKDDSPMPWGKEHKGKAMVDVPASYLLWMWENKKGGPFVRKYIKDNLEVLKKEMGNN